MTDTAPEESGGKLRILNFLPLLAVATAAAIFVYKQDLVSDLLEKLGSYPDDSLPSAHRVDFESPITGNQYEIYIQVPHGYNESDKRYPVFYSLDGRAFVSYHREIFLPLLRKGRVPETIVVGIDQRRPITPPRLSRFTDMFDDPRMRDYTFVNEGIGNNMTGGAPEFLAFLRDDIIPYIDGLYRTIPEDRAFSGFGLGGLFVMYTAFTEPELFQRYVALDPSLHRNNFAILGLEEKLAEAGRNLPISLYLSVGEMASSSVQMGLESMTDALLTRDYRGFRFRHEMYTQNEERNGILESLQNGLTFVYESSILDLLTDAPPASRVSAWAPRAHPGS